MKSVTLTLGLLLASHSLFAQANFGRILGTVTDQTGAVIAGAKVSIIDTQRGLARSLTTDQAGEYNAPTLIPGTYTIRVEVQGFKTLDRQNVLVEVGKEIRVDLTPEPGSQTQSVTINEAVPLVDTASATLGGTLSNSDINDMPLNGRNYQNLLGLRPGVMIQPGGSPWTQSTNNIRPDETAWMLDGVINANFSDARPIANMPSPFTDGATILPIDAIQEFNLEENPKAEYGWKPGAVVNVGIRSGTNTLHGSAYAFGRDGSWDARNLFNPAPQPVAPVELKQFGGVVGGPVKKDRLFFFAGYEGLRSIVGNAFASSVPEIAGQPKPDPKNSMVDAINALQAAGLTPSSISLKLLGCTPGSAVACTGGLIQGASANTTSYTSSFPNNNVSDNGIAKVDYRINSKHMINGMVLTGDYTGNGEDHAEVNSNFEVLVPIRTWTIVGNWIWTASSRVVNEARFGWNLVKFFQFPDDNNILADGKGYPLNTGVTTSGGLPEIRITPYAYIGAATNRPNGFSNPYYDYQDSLSYLRGKHTFKFGGGFTRIEVNNFNGNTSRGRIDFQGKQTPQIVDSKGQPASTPLEDFFAGNPSRGFLLIGNGVRTQHGTASSGFVQDDWRIRPKFMLNLGLRYAYASPFKEVNNLLGNFDPKLGMVQQGQPSVGDTLLHPNRKNFSPRVGFAWDVTGKGTTVVRAGASVIYSTLTSGIAGGLSLQNTGSTGLTSVPTGGCKTPVVVGVPCPETFGGTLKLASANIPGSKLNWSGVVFPTGAGISCTAAVPCSIMAVNPNLKTPYIVNWNFGVQHAFNPNLSLEVGYVGNHGDNLIGFRDINQIDITTGTRPYADKFPYLKFINRISNQARSNYDSLQSTLTKRTSHGLSFTAGYTYGHGLDNGSLNRFGYLPQSSLNPGAEYASGDFDIRHRFTLTTTYNIPGKKGFGQLLEGWKLNSIVNLQTSQPWEPNDYTNDFSGSGDQADRWNFFGNPNDFRSGSSSIAYCSGFGDPGGVSCTKTSGISGIVSKLPASLGQACLAVAPDQGTLHDGGCYVSGKSVMVPPKRGTYGSMGRNIFRDSGFKNWDFSVFKNFRFKERYSAQFRVEFFNLLNHPLISNPYGASTNYGGSGAQNDMGTPSIFGCGCATPDVSAGNPLIGSGSSRDVQLGMKFTF